MNSIKQTLFLAALTYTIVASALPPPRKAGTAGSTLRQSTKTKTHYLVNVNKGEPLCYTAVMLAYKGNTPGGAALVRKCAQAAVATPAFAGKTVALIPLASSFELEPSPESAPSRLAAACEACAKEHGLDWAVVPPATLARNRAVSKASVLDDAAKREHLKDIYVVPDHKLGLIRALEGKVALLVEDDEFTGASLDAAQRGLEDAMTRAGVNFEIERVVMARHKSYVQTSTMAELDAPTQALFQDVAFGIFADADADVDDGANIGVIYYFLIGERVYIGSHIASKYLYALGGRFIDAAANDEEEDASAIAFEIAKERVKQHAQQALKGEHNTKVTAALEEAGDDWDITAEGNYGVLAVIVGTDGQTRDCIKQKLLCLEQRYLNPLFDDTLALPAPLDWVAPDSDPLNVLEWAGCAHFGAYGKDPLDGFKLKRLCSFARAPRPQIFGCASAAWSIDTARRSPCGSGRRLPGRRRARRSRRRSSCEPRPNRARAPSSSSASSAHAPHAPRVLALERGRRRPVREQDRIRVRAGRLGPEPLRQHHRLARLALREAEGADPRPSPGPRARPATSTRPRATPCPRRRRTGPRTSRTASTPITPRAPRTRRRRPASVARAAREGRAADPSASATVSARRPRPRRTAPRATRSARRRPASSRRRSSSPRVVVAVDRRAVAAAPPRGGEHGPRRGVVRERRRVRAQAKVKKERDEVAAAVKMRKTQVLACAAKQGVAAADDLDEVHYVASTWPGASFGFTTKGPDGELLVDVTFKKVKLGIELRFDAARGVAVLSTTPSWGDGRRLAAGDALRRIDGEELHLDSQLELQWLFALDDGKLGKKGPRPLCLTFERSAEQERAAQERAAPQRLAAQQQLAVQQLAAQQRAPQQLAAPQFVAAPQSPYGAPLLLYGRVWLPPPPQQQLAVQQAQYYAAQQAQYYAEPRFQGAPSPPAPAPAESARAPAGARAPPLLRAAEIVSCKAEAGGGEATAVAGAVECMVSLDARAGAAQPGDVATGIGVLDAMVAALGAAARVGLTLRCVVDGVDLEPGAEYAAGPERPHDSAVFRAAGAALGAAFRAVVVVDAAAVSAAVEGALVACRLGGGAACDLAPYGSTPRGGRLWLGTYRTCLTPAFFAALSGALGRDLALEKVCGDSAHGVVLAAFAAAGAALLRGGGGVRDGAAPPGAPRTAAAEGYVGGAPVTAKVRLLNTDKPTKAATRSATLDDVLGALFGAAGSALRLDCDAAARRDDGYAAAAEVGSLVGQCVDGALGDRRALRGVGSGADGPVAATVELASGASHLEWRLRFPDEFAGDVAAENVVRLFRSLCWYARLTVHVHGAAPPGGASSGDLALAAARACGAALAEAAAADPLLA